MSDLDRAVDERLAQIEGGADIDESVERRVASELARLSLERELATAEVAARLAELVYRGCVAADAHTDKQRAIDSILL